MQWFAGVMCCSGTWRSRHNMVVCNSSQWPSFHCICPAAFWTVYVFGTHSMPLWGLPELHYTQCGNQLLLFISSFLISWVSPILALENQKRISCEFSEEWIWIFFFVPLTSLWKGRVSPQWEVSWEKTHSFKCVPWKHCSQDRCGSWRPCFFQALLIFLAQSKVQGVRCCRKLCHPVFWDYITLYTQPVQPWAATKKRWLHPVLCPITPIFPFLSLFKWLCSPAICLSWSKGKGRTALNVKWNYEFRQQI